MTYRNARSAALLSGLACLATTSSALAAGVEPPGGVTVYGKPPSIVVNPPTVTAESPEALLEENGGFGLAGSLLDDPPGDPGIAKDQESKLQAVPPGDGGTWDGSDPADTHCSDSAFTPWYRPLKTPDGDRVGTIELRYSKACRTAWARLTSTYLPCDPGDDACGDANVYRNRSGYQAPPCATPSGKKSCYTKQVDDANVTSYAHGYLTVGPTAAEATTKSY